jgi:hypothetical protein
MPAKTTKTPKPQKVGRPKGKPRTAAEIAADARRTGRPKNPEGVKQMVLVALRLTPEEFKTFSRDAKRAKLSGAAYAKHCWQQTRKAK